MQKSVQTFTQDSQSILLLLCVVLPYQSVWFTEGVTQQIKFSQKGDASLASASTTAVCHAAQSVQFVQLCVTMHFFFAFYWRVSYRHTLLVPLIPPGLEYQTCIFLLEMLTN